MIGRQEEKLKRLYLTWKDKMGIAKTMRSNLASDIMAGYHLANVTRQMIQIEDYEDKVVSKAEKDYKEYLNSVLPDKREQFQYERKWDKPIFISIGGN